MYSINANTQRACMVTERDMSPKPVEQCDPTRFSCRAMPDKP